MKIGILTLPFNNNYGGLLQSFALQTFLKDRGHEVYVIQKVNLYDSLKAKIKRLFFEKLDDKPMKRFVASNMNLTDKIYFLDTSNKLDKYNFDALIVGSDQVWRHEYIKRNYKNYFLNFAKEYMIKVAYAASFGKKEWTFSEIQTNHIKNLLHTFDAISVREIDGVNLCNEYLNINAELLVDPTLLLNPKEYIITERKSTKKNKKQILTYILDPTTAKTDILETINNKLDGEVIINGAKNVKGTKVYMPVDEWLVNFNNADFVFTDSYHGCLFSIIFNKPFIIFGNKKRGLSRFNSILKIFNLSNRLILKKNDLTDELFDPIDYSNINCEINTQRELVDTFFKSVKI